MCGCFFVYAFKWMACATGTGTASVKLKTSRVGQLKTVRGRIGQIGHKTFKPSTREFWNRSIVAPLVRICHRLDSEVAGANLYNVNAPRVRLTFATCHAAGENKVKPTVASPGERRRVWSSSGVLRWDQR